MAGNEKRGNNVIGIALNNPDARIPCKYGQKCYQKNPLHHQKYKHQPKRKLEAEKELVKKQKLAPNGNNEKKVPSPVHKYVPAEKPVSLDASVDEHKVLNVPEEEDELPPTPENVKEAIKQKFLVEMPEDFTPFEALRDVGLLLVGPFDVLSGKLKKAKNRQLSLYLIHWRYYYDPPEFQTVIKGDDTKQYHMGYFRDDPQELPCFVASNSAAIDCTITPMAENIFGAINAYLEAMKVKCDPFRKMKVSKIQTTLLSWAKNKDFLLDVSSPTMKARNNKVVTKTFHNGGMVVPLNKKTDLGYRELMETNANLKQILKNVVRSSCKMERDAFLGKLQPVVTAANIANDECDFGTSLELGLDLFSFGGEIFHNTALNLLKTAYSFATEE